MELHIINADDDPLLLQHSQWILEADVDLASTELGWLKKDNLAQGTETWLSELKDYPKRRIDLIGSIGYDKEEDTGIWLLLATVDGAPVGVSRVINCDNDTIWSMNSIWVDPDHRRKGVAGGMISKVKSVAKEHGGKQIQLSVFKRNEGASKLYHDAGFKEYISNMAIAL